MTKVFISGSIAIKKLPSKVIDSLERMIQNDFQILVGDADGIDKTIQHHFKKRNYFNVCIYSIYEKPRNSSSSFFQNKVIQVDDTVKKEREKQMYKDEAMTNDSDYSLVIWDGESKGSYQNILRALKQDKGVKVYSSKINDFIPQNKVNPNEVDYIFRENNGYSAKEVVEHFHNEGKEYFKDTRSFNKYLVEKGIIKKEEGFYQPLKHKELFLIQTYKGQETGIKFKNEFIDWLEPQIKQLNEELASGKEQTELFS